MSNGEIQLLIAAFKDENGADAALDALKQAKKEKLLQIKDAAVLRKDGGGKLHVKEIGDMSGGKGAIVGGVVGAGLGILSGGVTIALTGVGALVGGLAAKLRDTGFNDTRLKKLGEGLTPGSSAIVALTGDKQLAQQALEEFRKAGAADVAAETISADIAAQLDKDREVAYAATAGAEGVAAGRVVEGKDFASAEVVAATEDGIAAGRVVATPDAVVGERMAATKDGVAYEAAGVVIEEDSKEGNEGRGA